MPQAIEILKANKQALWSEAESQEKEMAKQDSKA